MQDVGSGEVAVSGGGSIFSCGSRGRASGIESLLKLDSPEPGSFSVLGSASFSSWDVAGRDGSVSGVRVEEDGERERKVEQVEPTWPK